jgi:RNA polymerase sigma factor (sigma-70 family)
LPKSFIWEADAVAGTQLFLQPRSARQPEEPPRWADLGDGDLLHRFVRHNEGRAFDELIRRHGPMVMGVCRRVLHHDQDAEDAFQAAFLVLARKAGSIQRHHSLAGWLYKVAYRIALRARAGRARLAAREVTLAEEPESPPLPPACTDLGLVDEEVHRLPEKYRAPVLLCYLQGRTNEEAARALRCPTGTVKIRLMRARELLRKRLTRRGLGLSVAALTALWAENAQAAVSATCETATLNSCIQAGAGQSLAGLGLSASALQSVRGCLRRLALAKIKLACAFLLLLALVFGADLLLQQARGAEPTMLPAKEMRVLPESDPLDSPGVRGLLISWRLGH